MNNLVLANILLFCMHLTIMVLSISQGKESAAILFYIIAMINAYTAYITWK